MNESAELFDFEKSVKDREDLLCNIALHEYHIPIQLAILLYRWYGIETLVSKCKIYGKKKDNLARKCRCFIEMASSHSHKVFIKKFN